MAGVAGMTAHIPNADAKICGSAAMGRIRISWNHLPEKQWPDHAGGQGVNVLPFGLLQRMSSQRIERRVARTQTISKGQTVMSTLTAPAISTWNIDSTHSVIEFKVKHMMISNLKGHFARVTGTLSLHEADLTQSSVEAAIESASIHTLDEGRDAHLKGADFFDAEQFPTMQLKSTHIALKSDGELVVTGDLTIKGVTRSVQFAVEGPYSSD